MSIKNLGALKANFLLVTIFLFLAWIFVFTYVSKVQANMTENSFSRLGVCEFDFSQKQEKIEILEFENIIVEEKELDLETLFEKYSQEYGVSSEILRSIAQCESGLNSRASNHIYVGLFQFAPATWISNRKAMGLSYDINLRYDAEESIRTAAFKISRDGTGAWPVCQHK